MECILTSYIHYTNNNETTRRTGVDTEDYGKVSPDVQGGKVDPERLFEWKKRC